MTALACLAGAGAAEAAAGPRAGGLPPGHVSGRHVRAR